jgi:hypothetical protein
MKREEMIEKLIDDDIETILNSGIWADYLSTILRRGTGYELQTDEEIELEFNSRTWEDE